MYLGFKDREQKLNEVHRAFKLTTKTKLACSEMDEELKSVSDIQDCEDEEDIEFYRSHCVKVIEAWEESGYLYIKSELCEKGNLNDYLMELGRKEAEHKGNSISNQPNINNKEWW